MKELFPDYSDDKAYRIAQLIAGYIEGTLSHNDKLELDDWMLESPENEELFVRLTDQKNIDEARKWMQSIDTESALRKAKTNLAFSNRRKRNFWKRSVPYAIAAAIAIFPILFVLKPFQKRKAKEMTETLSGEILPGKNKAILVLSGGETIVLENTPNNFIAVQANGSTTIADTGGELTYSDSGNTVIDVYNTITTPKGGQYKVRMADGSKVWLNAGSSIRFPVSFSGNKREVSITGEAYFEVAKDSTRPFIVKTNDTQIEVLGTSFNVSAYDNDPVTHTTLTEGRLKVSVKGENVILAPDEEASLDTNGNLKKNKVNTEQIIAWKDGMFNYRDQSIETIMKSIARWYDAEIEYRERPTDHFNIEISRDEPVSKVLRLMELTNRVYFKIENKKIIVSKHKMS